ncbi:MAG TPA: KTSC domain-containing protein [Rhizomicrobium sp.]|nr:KTSC domain-containing protein [Rhizomicrobium sp.]
MPYVQSVSIEAVAYDETAHLLRAKFRADGRVVVYENVPQDVYDSLIFAGSIGAYLREHIEGAYPAHEITKGVRQ